MRATLPVVSRKYRNKMFDQGFLDVLRKFQYKHSSFFHVTSQVPLEFNSGFTGAHLLKFAFTESNLPISLLKSSPGFSKTKLCFQPHIRTLLPFLSDVQIFLFIFHGI